MHDGNHGNFSDAIAAVDFQKHAPLAVHCPPDLLDVDSTTALVTAASLFAHPNVRLVNEAGQESGRLGTEQTQALAYLALWAAGAKVCLRPEQLDQLFQLSNQFMDGCEDVETHGLAAFIVRKARERRADENQSPIGSALAAVEFTCTRGFGELCCGPIPEVTKDPNKQRRMITLALLFSNVQPEYTSRCSQAVVYLALYAAGARLRLDKQQFRMLERRVRTYLQRLKAHPFETLPNGQWAHHVVQRSRDRARKHGLI